MLHCGDKLGLGGLWLRPSLLTGRTRHIDCKHAGHLCTLIGGLGVDVA